MHGKGIISIWFFIGVIVLVYGLIILPISIYDYATGNAQTVVLANLHAGVWWGILLVVLGLVYTIRFFPRKGTR